MHLVMIISILILAWLIRLTASKTIENYSKSWWHSFFLFIIPPLLLLMTIIAIIFMGPIGKMLGLQASWVTYILAIGCLVIAIILLLKLSLELYITQQKINSYSQELIRGKKVRILEIDFPYSATIGFWHSELIVSRGLLKILDIAHLEAVLAHEEAHNYYRDTFCFFWLSWLKSWTFWLPNTELLWQDLLFLRELRADQQASKTIDSLLLAESLLLVAQKVNQSVACNLNFNKFNESFCAELSCAIPRNRFMERIDALLEEKDFNYNFYRYGWSWIILMFFPLLTIPFHFDG